MQELSRPKPILKDRIAPEIEPAVVAMAIDQPAWGQTRVANELAKRGVSISPFGVCSVARTDLGRWRLQRSSSRTPVAKQPPLRIEIVKHRDDCSGFVNPTTPLSRGTDLVLDSAHRRLAKDNENLADTVAASHARE